LILCEVTVYPHKTISNSRNNADTTVANFDEVIRIFGSLEESFGKVQQMAAQTAQATQEDDWKFEAQLYMLAPWIEGQLPQKE